MRRMLNLTLAVLTVAALVMLFAPIAFAGGDHGHKKITVCYHGQTKTIDKDDWRKYEKKGAVKGECESTTTTVPETTTTEGETTTTLPEESTTTVMDTTTTTTLIEPTTTSTTSPSTTTTVLDEEPTTTVPIDTTTTTLPPVPTPTVPTEPPTLPFTGSSDPILAAVALALVATGGLVLRLTSKTASQAD